MMKFNSKTIAALDVGSSKISCIIAKKQGDYVQILGESTKSSMGIKAGAMVDLNLAQKSILAAIDEAETIAGERIDDVIIGIATNSIKSHHITARGLLQNKPILEEDINRIITHSISKFNKDHFEILHYITVSYSIDGVSGIVNPIGMVGKELSIKLHVITVAPAFISNLEQCIASCQLDIRNIVCSSFASALGCLTKDEMEVGAVLIDIGYSVTNVATFYHNKITNVATIPIGGFHITSDISHCLPTTYAIAERIKSLQGNLLLATNDDYEMLDFLSQGEGKNSENRQVPRSLVNKIIAARMEEILDLVKEQLSNFKTGDTISKRVVLTGGGSAMLGIKNFVGNYLQCSARIGTPQIEFCNQNMQYPSLSCAIGLIKFSGKDQFTLEDVGNDNISKSANFLNKVSKWLVEYF
jgi:cell division protein FtsA